MEKNQIWLWYKDEVLVDFFVIKEITEWEGEKVALLYDNKSTTEVEQGKYRQQFFDEMELLTNLTDMANKEEALEVYEFCTHHSIPLPGSKVRVDEFKASGKWYTTLEVDMNDYFDEVFTHDALKKALAIQQPHLVPIENIMRTKDSRFLICLHPFHRNPFPITIWLE